MSKAGSLIFPLLAFFLLGMVEWTSGQKGQFIVKVAYPQADILLTDEFVLSLDLTYPKDYHPDVAAIKRNLLTSRSFDPFPFFINNIHEGAVKTDANGVSQLHLEFAMEPILNGKHSLTFYNISFLPNERGSLKKEEIFSDVFQITVNPPKSDENFKGHPAALLDFSIPYPVEITPENRSTFIENPEFLNMLEKRNELILRNKTLPWAALACLFLAFLFFWASRQPSLAPKQAAAPQNKSSKDKVLKVFEGPMDNGEDFKKLSDFVKDALIEKRVMPGKPFTSEESLKYAMEHLTVSQEEKEKIKEFFILSDQVKFAMHQPTAGDFEKALQLAKELIQPFDKG